MSEAKNGNGAAPTAEEKARAKELVLREAELANAESGRALGVFSGQAAFASAQRIAQGLSRSTLVPEAYRGEGNLSNVLIAMELANRIGASVLMVMQNLYVVHGRPGWSSAFLIATINQCGRFTPLRFRWEGERGTDSWGCRAVAKDREDGEECIGALITIGLAKEEGWYNRAGSKWKTEMREQMLMYRAAAFWSRAYAPELSLGMQTTEEVQDVIGQGMRDLPQALTPGSVEDLEAKLGYERQPVEVLSTETGEVIDLPEPTETDAPAVTADEDVGDDGTLPGIDAEPKRGRGGRR